MKAKCQHDGECFGACAEHKSPAPFARPMREHDKITSRTTGKKVEIGMGPHGAGKDGGGLVPANPFASIAQARFLHAHPEKVGGQSALDEWDKSTDFKNLPKKKKGKK